jgi:hypothetical protein
MKKIYFDMDGTIADLYGVENWLPMLRAEDATPYRIAKPLVNITRFNVLCGLLRRQGYEIGVISWLSKESSKEYKKAVRAAKREWLKKYFPACGNEIHLVQYGTPKHSIVKAKGAILFDDEYKNGFSWERNGGEWINPTEKRIEKVLQSMVGI